MQSWYDNVCFNKKLILLNITYIVMLFDKSKHVLFKCDECGMIVSVDFDNKEDIEKLNEDKIILECGCGGTSTILRN